MFLFNVVFTADVRKNPEGLTDRIKKDITGCTFPVELRYRSLKKREKGWEKFWISRKCMVGKGYDWEPERKKRSAPFLVPRFGKCDLDPTRTQTIYFTSSSERFGPWEYQWRMNGASGKRAVGVLGDIELRDHPIRRSSDGLGDPGAHPLLYEWRVVGVDGPLTHHEIAFDRYPGDGQSTGNHDGWSKCLVSNDGTASFRVHGKFNFQEGR